MDFQRTNQQLHMNGGLTRYRSAPSSYFSSFLDAADEAIRNSAAGGGAGYGGDDLDHFLSRFMPSNSIRTHGQHSSPNNSLSNSMSMQSQSQFVASLKQEQETLPSQQLPQQRSQSNYSQVSSMLYQNQAQAQPQSQQQIINPEGSNASAVDNSYRLMNSVRSNRLPPMKMGNGVDTSNLVRYNSSPAGLFANINIENEYGALRGMGNFGAGNNANAEAAVSSASKFHGHSDFSSAQATSSGLMSPISEIGSTGMGETNPGDSSFVENQKNDSNYMSGFPVNSWDDSAVLSDSFLKGIGDDHDDNKAASNNNEGSNRPPTGRTLLSHHLSLPKTSDELSVMETLMQDSVLCKLRAKRGCATHPRSIAERVRRTRISERMRKLQDLVPNMDKQTNTSDMLDLAVDYIKDLQKQVQTLSDNRAKCTCLNE